MDIKGFWKDVLSQNRAEMPKSFRDDAVIRWHCSNEQFEVAEYIRANCDYPGKWDGEIERIEEIGNSITSVVRVFSADRATSFHVVSFIKFNEDLIVEMDEYWSDDGKVPEWRREMGIGKPIH